jgi:hypothetical protein
MKNYDDLLPKMLFVSSLLTLLFIVGVSVLLFTSSIALSAFTGGLVAIANLLWQRKALGALLQLTPLDRPLLATLIRFFIRLSLTAVALYLIITAKWFSLWGLLAGLSAPVICLLGLTFYIAIASKETLP